MIAKKLEIPIGKYIHFVGSFHLYKSQIESARAYLREGHQSIAEMPEMPSSDPFAIMPQILEIERDIRTGQDVSDRIGKINSYWADLLRLVQVHFNSDKDAVLDEIERDLSHRSYKVYLTDRRGRKPPTSI